MKGLGEGVVGFVVGEWKIKKKIFLIFLKNERKSQVEFLQCSKPNAIIYSNKHYLNKITPNNESIMGSDR